MADFVLNTKAPAAKDETTVVVRVEPRKEDTNDLRSAEIEGVVSVSSHWGLVIVGIIFLGFGTLIAVLDKDTLLLFDEWADGVLIRPRPPSNLPIDEAKKALADTAAKTVLVFKFFGSFLIAAGGYLGFKSSTK